MSMTFLAKWEPQLLSVLRIVVGLLFVEHGTAKLFHFPHVAMFDHIPPLIMVAGAIELVGGFLVTIGLFTRFAAFICSGEMAVAYWMYHVPHGGLLPTLNGGESAILLCFVFLFLAAAGPGPWSVDRK
jgi:putative oxidoreductase